MAHYFDVGFSVRQPSWHGLATVLPEYPGREEAIKFAGHDFHIDECPIHVTIPNMIGNGEKKDRIVEPVSMKDWKALVRDDNKSILSVVRGSYEIVQNETLWDIADAIVNEKGVKYETAGVLKNGCVLWVLVRLDVQSEVKGDNSVISPYVLLSTTHDGSGACKAQAVSIRVICWNTFNAADVQAKHSGQQFTFRHTKKVFGRIEDARSALGLVRHQHEEFIHLANELAQIEVDDKKVLEFVNRFIPEPTADIMTDRQKNSLKEARSQLISMIDHGETVSDVHRRTAYGMWSAGVEYLDHVRRAHNSETLFKRTMFDTTKVKSRMIDLVREIAV